MSIEICLICDRCGSIIAGGTSRAAVREDAKMIYQRQQGKDICTNCDPLPHNKRCRDT